jgi:hypothetical protein
MTDTIYAYAGPGGDAARYLIANSALGGCTEAGDEFAAEGSRTSRTVIALTTPRPSDGEHVLWSTARALANGDELVDIAGAARLLDADNRTALFVAVGIALGIAAPVGVTG